MNMREDIADEVNYFFVLCSAEDLVVWPVVVRVIMAIQPFDMRGVYAYDFCRL